MQHQDYYPYRMLQPGRNRSNAQSTLYGYGMNGMERMDETSGNGNAYTTFFRQYDARLGRWFSTDPVVHAYLSPYNAFDGNPIYFSDPRGDDSEGETNGETGTDEGGGTGANATKTSGPGQSGDITTHFGATTNSIPEVYGDLGDNTIVGNDNTRVNEKEPKVESPQNRDKEKSFQRELSDLAESFGKILDGLNFSGYQYRGLGDQVNTSSKTNSPYVQQIDAPLVLLTGAGGMKNGNQAAKEIHEIAKVVSELRKMNGLSKTEDALLFLRNYWASRQTFLNQGEQIAKTAMAILSDEDIINSIESISNSILNESYDDPYKEWEVCGMCGDTIQVYDTLHTKSGRTYIGVIGN